MGALVAQELAIGWPQLVRCAVLIATRARSGAIQRAQVAAERALLDSGVRVPREYDAFATALQMLSPATLCDDAAVSAWLEIFEVAGDSGAAADGQAWIDTLADRREVLRAVAAPCRVIAFTDDLIAPPHLCADVADAIPDCDLVEIPRCGHLGYLERPHEVNTAIIEFLDKH
jgi:pimeloyl-ACP methyl ester carboxylesterase